MDFDTLRRIEPLSSLPRHRLAEISRCLEWRRYAPGELILPHQVSDRPHGLVHRGRVEVTIVQQGQRHRMGYVRAEEPIPDPLETFGLAAVELRAVEATTLCWLPAGALEVKEPQVHAHQPALPPALAILASPLARLCDFPPALGQAFRSTGTSLSQAQPFAANQRVAGVLLFSILFLLPLTWWLWQSPLKIVRAKLAYALASQQLARGHNAEALLLLENSIALNPDLAMAYSDIGTIYHRWGWAKEARQAFQRAVAVDPASAVAQNNLGLSYLEGDQLGRAWGALQQAVVLDPENSAAWANLGLVAQHLGYTAEAMRDYRTALRLDPHQVTALANLGLLYYEQGRLAEAQEQLSAALHAQPDLPAARAVLGALAMDAGDQATARNALDAAAPDYSGDPVYHFYLGLWHEKAGDRDQAELEFARVRAMQPHPDLAALAHSHLVYLAPSEQSWGPDR